MAQFQGAWRSPESRARLGRWLLAANIVTSGLALGALHTPTLAVCAVLADVNERPSWCEDGRTPCLNEGLDASRRVKVMTPSKCEGYALTGELQVEAGEVDRGLDEIDGAIEHVDDPGVCARRLIELAQQTKRPLRVDAAIGRLLNGGCSSQTECVDNIVYAAGAESARGNTRRALALYKRAVERAPEREDLLVSVAELAAASGLHGEALEAYTTLARRQPADPRWPAAMARERELATRSVFERR
jgi:tetratricopeptide (TPR) repeat protein